MSSSLLLLDLPLLPVCKEVVSPEHEEMSSSLVQEETEGPPQIKEEPEEADMPRIIHVRSVASSGMNFNTTEIGSVDFDQVSDKQHM